MSRVWKWILGIVIVLILAGAVVWAIDLWEAHSSKAFAFGYAPFGHNAPAWNAPRGFEGGHALWMRDRGYGFFPVFGGLKLLGGFIKLAVFGALLYFAYWLGRRNARIALDPGPAAPAVEPDSTPKRGRKIAKSK